MGGACEFGSLSVETYGRMGEAAMARSRRLAEVAADVGRVNKQRWMKSALRKLSVALLRGDPWTLKAGLSVGARAAGRCSGQASRALRWRAAERVLTCADVHAHEPVRFTCWPLVSCSHADYGSFSIP